MYCMLLHYIIMLGPETWWIHYPSASGGMQSPIDIETEETLPLPPPLLLPLLHRDRGDPAGRRVRTQSPRGELPRPGCISWGSGILRKEETIWGHLVPSR